ncbi:hypothetical protein AVEN_28950-1 [Araneus ventricosus]|uniref:Uncharacterized protein n=1 Tax=Araneus ventricosus TaxID=182803 RepID=A0A4Y2AJT1_ARAVE|nr:hypothetical protein AVEN_28950-1 [Araneus ventricosus]
MHLNYRVAAKGTQELWSVTKWPSTAHAPTPPVGGASHHRGCGKHSHTTITIPTREARTRLLIQWLIIYVLVVAPQWDSLRTMTKPDLNFHP